MENIQAEIRTYSSMSGSLLSKSGALDLPSFNLKSLHAEFKETMPKLSNLITKLCSINIEKRKNTKKTVESILPVIVTIICKILSTHNQRLSAAKYVISMVLKTGGAKETCINRLSFVGDAMSSTATFTKLDEMADAIDTLIEDWDDPVTDSSIVFDNVNPYVTVRQETHSKHGTLHSLTQAIGVRDRVPTNHIPNTPKFAVADVTAEQLLPSAADTNILNQRFITTVRNTWARYIPSLSWMEAEIPTHKYSQYAGKTSQVVGV